MPANAAVRAVSSVEPPFPPTPTLLLGTSVLGIALWLANIDWLVAGFLNLAIPDIEVESLVGGALVQTPGYELRFAVTGHLTFLG